jgi:hypothetical protein
MARRVAVTEQRTTVFGELAGFYRIEQGAERTEFFANYFDAEEARLLPASSLGPAPPVSAAAMPALARPRPFHKEPDLAPWLLLLGCALVLSFSEWWTYHRRWTV